MRAPGTPAARLADSRPVPRILAALWLLGVVCTQPAANARAAERELPYASPRAVNSWLDAGRDVLFLDVRERDEFAAGHIAGARTIVYERVAELAPDLPTDQPIVLYCIHSAHRAPEAAKTLTALGFTNAYVLEGGLVAWQVAGFPLRAADLARAPTILPTTERCEQAATPH